MAGSFANATGTLGSGTADVNVGGSGGIAGPLTGGNGTLTTTAPSATTGRGTGSYTIPNGASTITFDFAYYVVNADDIYFVTNDTPVTGNFLLSGRALKALATSTDLNGYYMPAVSGLDLSSGDGIGNNSVGIGTLQATAETIPTATIYSNDAGTFTTNTYTNGTYTFDSSTGRITFGALVNFARCLSHGSHRCCGRLGFGVPGRHRRLRLVRFPCPADHRFAGLLGEFCRR